VKSSQFPWRWISNKCQPFLFDLGMESHQETRMFPRKEVIQPHLPVRLPCYDFTPITDPTLDACLPCGLAQRLQVLPTFVV
jgi:hypothetical protein